MKKSTIFIVMALLCLKSRASAVQAQDIFSPEIGVNLPQSLMNLTFVEAKSSKATKFSFNSLKKRLIILDFWGEYCAPCIRALPGYEKINSDQGTDVKIVAVSDFKDRARLLATLKKFKLDLTNTPTLLNQETLNRYFPHRTIPHAVWILDGKLLAETEGEFVKLENIQKALSPQGLKMPLKIDVKTKPTALLPFIAKKENAPKTLYYSAFSSYIEGISPSHPVTIDPGAQTITISYFNIGLLGFCRLVNENKFVYDRSDFLLDVVDSSKFIFDNSGYFLDWKKQNTFCYTIVLPASLPEQNRTEYIQGDIKRWLKLLGIETGKFKKTENPQPRIWIKQTTSNTQGPFKNINQ